MKFHSCATSIESMPLEKPNTAPKLQIDGTAIHPWFCKEAGLLLWSFYWDIPNKLAIRPRIPWNTVWAFIFSSQLDIPFIVYLFLELKSSIGRIPKQLLQPEPAPFLRCFYILSLMIICMLVWNALRPSSTRGRFGWHSWHLLQLPVTVLPCAHRTYRLIKPSMIFQKHFSQKAWDHQRDNSLIYATAPQRNCSMESKIDQKLSA